MELIWNNILFGITLTTIAFELGVFINKKTGWALANPLLLSILFCYLFLKGLKIEYSSYMKGGSVITMLILPSTAAVGLSLFRQIKVFKKELLPIIVGSLVSCLVTVFTVPIVCNLFQLEAQITASLIPKSITTAIALDVSEKLGGIKALTMAAVILTGIVGSMLNAFIVSVLKWKNSVGLGVAFGSTCHATGTAKAMEYGELVGAVSGICIGVAGLITSIIALFL